jgi:hypothetical protein
MGKSRLDAAVRAARTALSINRTTALDFAGTSGVKEVRTLLERAARDLTLRLERAEGLKGEGEDTFTITQLRTSLAQIKLVVRQLARGMETTLVDVGKKVGEQAVSDTANYLRAADKAFRGVGVQPLALREAMMLSTATQGVRASMLRRLASSGTPAAKATEVRKPHPAKLGILERYGVETIRTFETTLQKGMLARKSWGEMRDDITETSPFLKSAPAFWATRIVRTEVMGAYNRAGWEATRQVNDDLGDMVKILSATFDERTGSDSYAVHGQIRLPEEPFESWFGAYQHPPNRPNDREVVVPHRISWIIPPYLAWRTPGEISAAWHREGRKGPPPERPAMTTVDLSRFGQRGE